jgi:inosose dehydratase
MVTRREFLETLGAAAATVRLKPAEETVRLKPDTTYGTRSDSSVVSGFSRTVGGAASTMRFGYAAITWGNALDQAMDDIAAVGFRAIQLRGEAFAQFGDRPAVLRDQLDRHKLAFAVLSSGNLSIDPAREKEMIDLHVRHARFVRDAGGKYLQVIDERPKERPVVADDYRRLGRLMTDLGKRTADLGVPLVYHHHMNSTGEKPPEVRAVLDAADRRHVRLLFDVAHYQQGGGDPVAAIREYREWIDVVHLKDVRSRGAGGSGGAAGSNTYEFVELGRGRVDLPGVFAALRDIAFDKWAIVELDRVPEPGRTPKESAEINKRYLIETAHQVV